MKIKSSTQKLAVAALLAALTCVATMVIKIPSPLKGYLNLGDCVVLVAGWMLPSGYGFLAARGSKHNQKYFGFLNKLTYFCSIIKYD